MTEVSIRSKVAYSVASTEAGAIGVRILGVWLFLGFHDLPSYVSSEIRVRSCNR